MQTNILPVQKFGDKLKALRKRQRMTLQELSRALGYADHSYLSRVENGKKSPSIELVLAIAHLFNVTTDQLLRDEVELE